MGNNTQTVHKLYHTGKNVFAAVGLKISVALEGSQFFKPMNSVVSATPVSENDEASSKKIAQTGFEQDGNLGHRAENLKKALELPPATSPGSENVRNVGTGQNQTVVQENTHNTSISMEKKSSPFGISFQTAHTQVKPSQSLLQQQQHNIASPTPQVQHLQEAETPMPNFHFPYSAPAMPSPAAFPPFGYGNNYFMPPLSGLPLAAPGTPEADMINQYLALQQKVQYLQIAQQQSLVGANPMFMQSQTMPLMNPQQLQHLQSQVQSQAQQFLKQFGKPNPLTTPSPLQQQGGTNIRQTASNSKTATTVSGQNIKPSADSDLNSILGKRSRTETLLNPLLPELRKIIKVSKLPLPSMQLINPRLIEEYFSIMLSIQFGYNSPVKGEYFLAPESSCLQFISFVVLLFVDMTITLPRDATIFKVPTQEEMINCLFIFVLLFERRMLHGLISKITEANSSSIRKLLGDIGDLKDMFVTNYSSGAVQFIDDFKNTYSKIWYNLVEILAKDPLVGEIDSLSRETFKLLKRSFMIPMFNNLATPPPIVKAVRFPLDLFLSKTYSGFGKIDIRSELLPANKEQVIKLLETLGIKPTLIENKRGQLNVTAIRNSAAIAAAQNEISSGRSSLPSPEIVHQSVSPKPQEINFKSIPEENVPQTMDPQVISEPQKQNSTLTQPVQIANMPASNEIRDHLNTIQMFEKKVEEIENLITVLNSKISMIASKLC